MKRPRKWIAATILTLSLSGCQSIGSTAKLPVPVQPEYPSVQAEKLQCLDKETMKALVERDTLKTEHITTLENVIKKTH